MIKRILLTVLLLYITLGSYAQTESLSFKCPHCGVPIETGFPNVCWYCKGDLRPFWRNVNRGIIIATAFRFKSLSEAQQFISSEREKKNALNQDFFSQANTVILEFVDEYEKEFSEIETSLHYYYDNYDINTLDQVRTHFNNTIASFVIAIKNSSEIIDCCEEDTYNRLDRLVDKTNSLRREIESAKTFVPDELALGELMLVKKGQEYKVVLPESFSSSTLIVPSSYRFNYNDVAISGLSDDTDLSKYPNLESIEFHGSISTIDAAQLNNCPKLKSVYFSEATLPPAMVNGNCLRDDIDVYVSLDAISTFSSAKGWDASNLTAKGDNHYLYAKHGVVYFHDGRTTQVNINQYRSESTAKPTILSSVKGVPVTKIGSYAFAGSNIETIDIPSSITEIENDAFSGCAKLKKISIPANVIKIGKYAFVGCLKLEDVIIEASTPPSVSLYFVPPGCWINVNEGLLDTFIETFPYNKFTRIRESRPFQYRAYDGAHVYLIKELDRSAKLIKGKNIETLSLSDRVFDGNFNLTGIGSHAFDGCDKLTSLTIPITVDSIDAGAFFGASKLSSFYSLRSIPPVCDKPIFDKKNSCCVYVPLDAIKSYKKEKGWKSAKKILPNDNQ